MHVGSCKNYFSAPKEVAKQRFPANIIWVSDIWIYKIRLDIENTVLQRCIELGLPTSYKSIPVGREDLLHLNTAMLSMQSAQDQRVAVEYRAALNMTFSATGRGGECAYSKYSRSHWDSVYHCWVMDWYCRKTNAVKQMSLFCDAEHFEMDIFHSMACYWVLGAGSVHISFPDITRRWPREK